MTTAASTFRLEEYNALRTGFGYVPLAGWSNVTLSGADRQKFLNSFCTNDVKRLQPGEHCEAFITNVKGKIIGLGLVDCHENELAFITVPDQAATIIAHLDRYVIREDVQLHDTTGERAYLLVAGGNHVAVPAGLGHWIRWRLLEVPVCGLLEVTTADLDRAISQLKVVGAVECGDAAFHSLRVESGTPLFGTDFSTDNLPQEVGRDEQAISFTKGCYLGQETVARIDAMGHVNQQLVGVRFAGLNVPESGTELLADGKPVGHLTSATLSPLLAAPLALAIVRRRWSTVGSQLESPAGPCEVIELPLHSPN